MANVHEPDDARLRENVRGALDEDLGSGDVTAALIPATATAVAHVVSRETATLAGSPWFDEVFRQVDPGCSVSWHAKDGEVVDAGARVCTVRGNARSILSGERTALNFLQTLSGTATVTARYARAIAGTGCAVLDTRKTLPGLRLAQKYAVRCGGGRNHRTGLYDGIPMTEKSVMDVPHGPDVVWLFRRPILDEWADRGNVTLTELVAHVTIHEFAHHFGWSDDDIAAIDPWWE